MHRETMVGLALASALAELEEEGKVVLNAKQREAVWVVFDESMDCALEEVPTGCIAKVYTSAAAKSEKRSEIKSPEPRIPTDQDESVAPAVSVADVNDQFPLYRKIDGLTTLVLKDPEVVVAKRNGEEERIKLDFLTVRIKDVSEKKITATRKRPR